MIPPGGTFDYTVVVPAQGTRLDTPLPVQPGDAVDRLVGPAPTVRILDAGLAPGAPSSTVTGGVAPRVLRSRIVIATNDPFHALAAEASFHVDQELIAALRPGDVLRLARNHIGGLAVAITREQELVAAAGALTSIPLGNVTARIPRALIEAALDVFRAHDQDFQFREWPVEVVIGNDRLFIFSGRRDIAGYFVYAEHGLFAGDMGLSECVAVARTTFVPDVVAIASAQLMDSPEALQLRRW